MKQSPALLRPAESTFEARTRKLREVMAEVDFYAGTHTAHRSMPLRVKALDVTRARSRVVTLLVDLIEKG